MSKPIVVYWNSQPAPYMVERWNEVARRGNIELSAWFNVEREADRSWSVDSSSWLFDGRYLPTYTIFGHTFYMPPIAARPDLVVQEYATPEMMLGLLFTKGMSRRVAFRTLPTYEAWTQRTLAKEVAKHILFRSVDGVKTGSDRGVEMYSSYGIPRDRLFKVTQSVDVEFFSRARELPLATRAKVRKELGVEGVVFVYVGRLWKKKGLSVLLDAYARLRMTIPATTLLLVGDGLDEDYYRQATAHDPTVKFLGFRQKEELVSVLGASDVFVFPTLGDPHGLVVEEAMAAGLPVLSSSAAGGIEQRVPNGIAGFIHPAGDSDRLASSMETIATDDALRKAMSNAAFELVQSRSHQRYAEEFEHFVFRTLATSPRRNLLARAGRIVGKGLTRALALRDEQA
jgi:glycosyltransferase involved in cell wall biosynthesis